jgi:undecaprenyl-phosphate 4-deoxy-4-formamido-L-arabinose transferase
MIGLLISMCSFGFVVFLLLRRIIVGPEVEGVFTLFAIMFFVLGIVLFGLGVVGEYIGRIYQEVRKRPRFVVKHVLEAGSEIKAKSPTQPELQPEVLVNAIE